MKKSFLALAVAALAATSIASTASATTFYDKDGYTIGVHGRVQSIFYSDDASGVSYDKNDGGVDTKGSINTSGRLGFDFRSQLTSGVAAFAMAEWEVANDNNKVDGSDNFMNRLMWVGVDFGQFGSVKVGKFEEAIKYAISQTDIFDDWGCTGLAGNDDRREGTIMYQWSGYGVDAFLSYAFAKENEHIDGAYYTEANGRENVDMDYSISAALGYTSPDVLFGPVAARVGFAYGKMEDSVGAVNNYFADDAADDAAGTGVTYSYDKYTQFAVGLSWGKLNLGPYVGAEYQQRKFDLNVTDANGLTGSDDYTVKGYEFVAGYSFANGVLVRTGYLTQVLDQINGESLDAKTVPVYVNWSITPNFQVWGEARFDAGTDDSLDKRFDAVVGTNYAENVFSTGIRYNF